MAKKAKRIDMNHDTFEERLGAARENTAKAQELARDLGITDRATMKHAELLEAIKQAEPSEDHAAM